MLFLLQTILFCILLSAGISIGIRLAEYVGWGGWLFPPILGLCTVVFLTWPIGRLLKIYSCIPRPSSHSCNSQKCTYHRLSKDKHFHLWRCDVCGKILAQLRKTQSIKGSKYKGREWFIVLDSKSNPTIVVQCSMGNYFPKRRDKVWTNSAVTERLIEYFYLQQHAKCENT